MTIRFISCSLLLLPFQQIISQQKRGLRQCTDYTRRMRVIPVLHKKRRSLTFTRNEKITTSHTFTVESSVPSDNEVIKNYLYLVLQYRYIKIYINGFKYLEVTPLDK